jgi:hypothetical protein
MKKLIDIIDTSNEPNILQMSSLNQTIKKNKAMNTIKIFTGANFTTFEVVNKYILSKKEQLNIFNTLNVESFQLCTERRTYTYYKSNLNK